MVGGVLWEPGPCGRELTSERGVLPVSQLDHSAVHQLHPSSRYQPYKWRTEESVHLFVQAKPKSKVAIQTGKHPQPVQGRGAHLDDPHVPSPGKSPLTWAHGP